MTTLAWMYGVMGIILALLALPLYFEKVPPNGLYGFRIPKTIANPRVWYAVNKYSARWLFATGVLTSISALALYQLPGLSLDAYALACLCIFIVIFGMGLFFIIRYMNSL